MFPSIQECPGGPAEAAGKMAGDQPRLNASALSAEPQRVTAVRIGDRLLVQVTRRHTRVFSMSVPEAANLICGLVEVAPELRAVTCD